MRSPRFTIRRSSPTATTCYVILHGIDFKAREHAFHTQDVDFFLSDRYLVTVHPGISRSIGKVGDICTRNSRVLGEGPAALMHRIIDTMVDNYRPEVEKLQERLDELEKEVFGRARANLARRIIDFKRDVASLRRVVLPERDVVGRLARREFPIISESLAYRYRDVYDHLVRLTDESVFLQDRISSLLEAHLSAVSNQLNSVMKVLTVIATIFMPLTVLTGMYGMNVRAAAFAGRGARAVLVDPVHHARDHGSDALHVPTPGVVVTSRIRRLPLHLANQIAAGEVVERPASVVKELVENALDANARRIAVTIELGGKKLIRVEDDGDGMVPEDARLAIERHATSKIASPEDLGAIRTLGFRGEALPSIASVSHFVLRSRARGQATGTEIRVNGGTVASDREVGAPEGTSVEVADLFYNLPARRKFLKSDAAEAGQISRLMTQIALGYPEVGFTVTSGGRRLLECPPSAGLKERFFQLFGERFDLVELRKEAAGLSILGYVAVLGDQGPVRGPQNVFVNRRIVKDRTIAHAISEAYSVATIKERSPEVHLFIDIPPDRVDVNVHPTKAEVRFLEQSLVHEVLRRGLADALGQGRAPELFLTPVSPDPDEPRPMSIPGVLAGAQIGSRWTPAHDAVLRSMGSGSAAAVQDAAPVGAIAGGQAISPADIRPMIPLGQFRDTFIIAVDDEGVAIIDQHVAHERVLFEQVMEKLTAGRLESQRLLAPILIELSPTQRQAVGQHAATLDRFGLEIEEFGGDSLRLSAVPALLQPAECEAAIRALAEDLEGLDRGSRVEDALRKIAATMACHAAVKANYPLTLEKMRYLLEELRRTAYSSVCPHGRPVVLRLSRREIEKNFQRI